MQGIFTTCPAVIVANNFTMALLGYLTYAWFQHKWPFDRQ